MAPRYSVDHTKTPTRADIDFIASHPDCMDRLQKFLRINDLNSVEDPSPEFYLDMARLLLAYNAEGSLRMADDYEREFSERWSPKGDTPARVTPVELALPTPSMSTKWASLSHKHTYSIVACRC